MKRTGSVLILMFAATTTWAQTINPTQALGAAHNAAAKSGAASRGATAGLSGTSGATSPASTAKAKPAAAPASTEPLGDAARKVAKPIATSKPKTAPKPAAVKAKPAAAGAKAPAAAATAPAPAKDSQSTAHKRDPFISPIVSRVSGPIGCSGGKKCLVIDQVALKGVVKASFGMIAVIVNSGNKAYFMRENDPVWNGFVVKITSDSIVFRETVTDRIGRTSTRDIVKRVNTPSV